MSLFDTIKNAIFGHGAAAAPASSLDSTPTPPGAAPTAAPPAATVAPAPAALSSTGLQAMLTQMNAKSSEKLNWQTSIVDLMKLVGLDPSLANRKQLAQELGYTGDMADSASMNIWLHQTVMAKLAASGGQVTPALKA